jgi:hypothetical protein
MTAKELSQKLAHRVMTPEEYQALNIKGWHEVCKNVDGLGGVGVRSLYPLDPLDEDTMHNIDMR